jgi:hypothetical protein
MAQERDRGHCQLIRPTAIPRRTHGMTAPHSALMPPSAGPSSLAKSGICGPFLGGTRRRDTAGVAGGSVGREAHTRRGTAAHDPAMCTPAGAAHAGASADASSRRDD